MAQKKSYSRYFIILQEDEKGYSLSSDKIASGYAKLELKNDKCKISYYVQNLKKEMAPYYMMLICNKKDVKKIIKISEMNIDDYGRADIFYEYPVSNIAGSNISMDKVSGAAIVKLVEGNIIPVMSGFASTEVPEWKSFEVIGDINRGSNQQENTEEKIIVEEKSIFDKYEQSIELAKQSERKENIDEEIDQEIIEDKRQEIIEDIGQEIIEDIRQEEAVNPVEEEIKEDVAEPLRQEVVEEIEQDKKCEDEAIVETRQEEAEESHDGTFETTDNQTEQLRNDESEVIDYPRGSTAKFFKSLTEGFDEIPDMCREIKRCKCHKVHVKNLQSMYDVSDYNKYTVAYYPMINYYRYIKKYDHYLVGYKCDKAGEPKYLIYGIPGTRDRIEQPYEGKSGFVTWVPTNDRADFGYWLMFYDFKTSTILIPEKK